MKCCEACGALPRFILRGTCQSCGWTQGVALSTFNGATLAL